MSTLANSNTTNTAIHPTWTGAVIDLVDRHLALTVAVTGRLKDALQGERSKKKGLVHPIKRLFQRTADGIDFVARGVFHVWRMRKYYTPVKLANMAVVNLQFAYKAERVIGRPYQMKIESTNICNTKCQLCPTGIDLKGRAKGKMTFDQYANLIDQVKWHLVDLDLSMWGDPLIVPDIYKMIEHAHDRGIWTYISSNLHAYKLGKVDKRWGKTHAEMIVDSGLDMLTCSLHGASQETYEIYQPGKKFDDSLAKVKEIIATRDRMGSQTPFIQLNFVVTKFNEHEIGDFQKLCDELNVKAIFSMPSMNARFQDKDKNLVSLGLGEDLKKEKVKKHLEKWLPKDESFVLEPYKQMVKDGIVPGDEWNGEKQFNCSWPWRQSVINWDGNVVTCCGNYDPKEDMGNVFDDPKRGFAKVWNGEKYRMARRSFKKKVSDEHAEGNACASCPGFML